MLLCPTIIPHLDDSSVVTWLKIKEVDMLEEVQISLGSEGFISLIF